MAERAILFVGAGPWRLAVSDGRATRSWESSAVDGPPNAAAVAAQLRAEGSVCGPVALALPSEWVFSGFIATDGLGRRDRRQSMLYRLEEQLPLPAEALAADFLDQTAGAMGLAVAAEHVEPIVRALESAGLAVELIAPAAVLAAQQLVGAQNVQDGILLLESQGRVEFCVISAGKLRSWATLPADGSAVARHVRKELLGRGDADGPVEVLAALESPEIVQTLDATGGLRVRRLEAAAVDLAAAAAAAALTGACRCWFNLRRGPLADSDKLRSVRRPLNVLAVLAAVTLLAACGAFLWRAHRCRVLADRLLAAQADIHYRLHPGQPVPVSVRWRLESDARRLRGLQGITSDVPERPSALASLRDLIVRLPSDVRLRLLDLRIEPEGLLVEGQARSHGDAEAIAEAVGKGGAFRVEPPRTDRLADGGVSFTLIASPGAARTGGAP